MLWPILNWFFSLKCEIKSLFGRVSKNGFWGQFLKTGLTCFQKQILNSILKWRYWVFIYNVNIPKNIPHIFNCFSTYSTKKKTKKKPWKHNKFVLKKHVLKTNSQKIIFIKKFIKSIFEVRKPFSRTFPKQNLSFCKHRYDVIIKPMKVYS